MTSSQEEALGPLRPLLIPHEQGSESFNDAAQHSVTWYERGGRKIKVHHRRWNYEGGILWRYNLLRLVEKQPQCGMEEKAQTGQSKGLVS